MNPMNRPRSKAHRCERHSLANIVDRHHCERPARLCVILALGLSMTGLGCRNSDTVSASCGESSAVTLALSGRIDVPLELPPRVVVRTNSGFLALNQAGDSLVWFSEAGGTPTALAVPGLRGLAVSGLDIIGFSGSNFFTVKRNGLDPWPSPEALSHSTVRSVHRSDEGNAPLWVIADQGDETFLYLFGPGVGPDYQLRGRWPIDGRWRAAPVAGGGLVLAETHLPFGVSFVSHGGPIEARTNLAGQLGEQSDEAAFVASGLTPIGCGRTLVTLSDLRSTARWIVNVDFVEGKVLRATSVSQPLSFFHADTIAGEVLAYHAGEADGQILIYTYR